MPMMDNIRDMVINKRMFVEAAKLVLEDESLDDLVLNEADNNLPEGSKDPLENDNSAVQRDGELPMSTGEKDSDSDIMNQEIDLRSDTVSSTVPVPPAAAANQMDDMLNQPIDSPVNDVPAATTPPVEEPASPEPTPEAPSNTPEGDLMDTPLNGPSSEPSSTSGTLSGKDMMDEPLTSEERDSINKDESGDLLEARLFNGDGYSFYDGEDFFGESVIDDRIDSPRPNRSTNFLGDIFGESRREPPPRGMTDEEILQETAEVVSRWKPRRKRREIDFMMEAISVDGADDEDSDIGDDDGDDEAPDSDNTVTAAVKDKVGEIEDEDDTEPDAFSANIGDSGAPNGGNKTLYKKLSKLTKDIEDIKAETVFGEIE